MYVLLYFIEKWQQHGDIEEVRKYQNTQTDEKDLNDDASSVNSESKMVLQPLFVSNILILLSQIYFSFFF